MNRIYVCHTYYHVYVTILKELNYQKTDSTKGTIALSLVSTDFKDLKLRLQKSNIFHEVIRLNEVHPWNFEEKFKYETGIENWFIKNFFDNFFRWKYTAKQEHKYLNINFSDYNDIFVYCDSDPIGQYLNYYKIPYHAVEDGLNSCTINSVRSQSRFFLLKLLLSKTGVIFTKDGYSKYAIDLEVNDKKDVERVGRMVTEVSRKKLLNALTDKEKELIYDVFYLGTNEKTFRNYKKNIMIMTQPLCRPEKRIEMYRDIIQYHGNGYNVYIKPHPIDDGDYEREFPDCIVLERYFPVEILNIKCELDIEKIITIYSTSIDELKFAKVKIRIGIEFLDNYEDPELHKYLVDAEKKLRQKK